MNIVSLGKTGLQDWLLQRLTALVLIAYILFLATYLCRHSPVDYQVWQTLFESIGMQIATFIVLLSLSIHTWLGLWMIVTDYIKPRALRLVVTSILVLVMLSYLIWGITILWR
jgi:succinate dehydrogenase / fumarate reductase membrane anchor subunit